MEKTYNPHAIEQSIYTRWENEGFFKPNMDASKDSYCICLPPPNVTGSLHGTCIPTNYYGYLN